jgi:hypothetical protein
VPCPSPRRGPAGELCVVPNGGRGARVQATRCTGSAVDGEGSPGAARWREDKEGLWIVDI